MVSQCPSVTSSPSSASPPNLLILPQSPDCLIHRHTTWCCQQCCFQAIFRESRDLLLSDFWRGQVRSYSSMNSNRSDISAIASVQGQPTGQHLLVSRFLKGVFQERPSLLRCRTTWAPDLIFRLLATEARSQHCFIYYSVVQEVCNLNATDVWPTCRALQLLDIRNMCVSAFGVTFQLGNGH